MNIVGLISIVAMSLVGFCFSIWMARHDNLEVR